MKACTLVVALLLGLSFVVLAADTSPKLDRTNLHQMEDLVKQGADVNAPIGHVRMLREGERPADVPGSYFPLDAAVESKQHVLVKRLLALGAKPRGNELADAVFQGCSVDMAKTLLAAGIDPNSPKHRVYGPALVAAASRGNEQVVALLLEQPNIKVDIRDVDGQTALMLAAKHGSTRIVDMLLEAGANPIAKNRHGQTAASIAQREIDTRRKIISSMEAVAR